VKHPLSQLSPDNRELLRESDQPDWIEPMLATLTDRRFSDDDWIFERKLDGERCLAYRSKDEVRLMSRNRKQLNAHYPELVEALAAARSQAFVIDGEVWPSKEGSPVSPSSRGVCI
jgi:bifunctional non-homologous end joining protein LigD